jgi:hypothetical protein
LSLPVRGKYTPSVATHHAFPCLFLPAYTCRGRSLAPFFSTQRSTAASPREGAEGEWSDAREHSRPFSYLLLAGDGAVELFVVRA